MDDNKKFRNTKHCGGAVFKNGYKDNDKKPEWVNAEFESVSQTSLYVSSLPIYFSSLN